MKKNVLGFITHGNFHHFSALRGEKGEKGDTVVVGDGDPMTMYNSLGNNTDGPMTQDAVTKALSDIEGTTNKGIFSTYASLAEVWPVPVAGWVAYVGESMPLTIYGCKEDGEWYDTGMTADFSGVNLSNVAYIAGVAGDDEDVDDIDLFDGVDDVYVDDATVVEEVTDDDGKVKKIAKISLSGLQSQIDEIVADKATVSLKASPSLVYYNTEAVDISLTASVSGATATSISISGGGLSDAITGSGKSLATVDSITPTANVSYAASFVVAGQTKSASAKVTVVRRIYYGTGTSYSSATQVASIRTSPAGDYSISITGSSAYIYWLVPSAMKINGATMGGFNFPITQEDDVTKDGVSYKCYRSVNAIEAGNYTIKIN